MGTDSNSQVIEALRKLLDSVRDPGVDDWDPIELGLLISKLEYADLDLAQQRAVFNEMAASVTRSVNNPALKLGDLKSKTQHIAKIFSQELGFAGDKTNYYNIKNSFLNDVFLRRKGIPISLSLVFMGLCRAAGLKAVGVSFPGHFLVKMMPAPGTPLESHNWRDQWFVDPFDGGAILSIEDCEKRLKEWTRGVIPFGPEALKLAAPLEITSRVLRNLRAIFAEKEDFARLYWVLTGLVELSPNDRLEAYRERGFLMARMGRFQAACEDLRLYLGHSRDMQKVAHVERMLRFIESQKEMPN
ncbi:MAG: transglutaminase family protein [Bdellovibrionales bacterium]|nr:transglutaminase family protein [Bdellovibrionales bacterium]